MVLCMRKILIAFLLLTFLCSCSASQFQYPTDNTYHAGTDYQYNMYSQTAIYNITDSGEGYYFWVPFCLLYIDKASMTAVPVCSKPNCRHYEETDAERYALCDAFIQPVEGNVHLFWNEGNLYAIQRAAQDRKFYELVKISPDGSRREILHQLGEVLIISGAVTHRGYLYAALTYYDENMKTHCGIWKYSLNNPSEKPIQLLELQSRGSKEVLHNMTAYGNHLYFCMYVNDDIYDGLFVSCDIQTGELQEIMATDDGFKTTEVTFVDGKLLVLRSNATQENTALDGENQFAPFQIWLCDIDGSNPRLLGNNYGTVLSDGEYIYRGGFLWLEDGEDHFLHIYDADYNELDTVDLCLIPGITTPWMFAYYPTMDDRVLILTSSKGEKRFRLYWFDKSQIGSGAIEVHPVMDFEDEYRGAFAHGGTLKIK